MLTNLFASEWPTESNMYLAMQPKKAQPKLARLGAAIERLSCASKKIQRTEISALQMKFLLKSHKLDRKLEPSLNQC